MRLIVVIILLAQFSVYAQQESDPRREFVEIYDSTLAYMEKNDKIGLRLYFIKQLTKENELKTLIGKSGLNFLYASFLKDVGEFDSSIVHFNKVEYYASKADPIRKEQMLSKAYLQKTYIYFDTQKLDSARVYLKKTKGIDNLSLNINEVAFLNNIEGYFAFIDGDYSKAESIYNENIEIHKSQHPCELPLTYVKKIELYDKLNKLVEMEEAFNSALYYVDSCENKTYEVYLRSTISGIYERRGMFEKSFQNYKIARILDDSIKKTKRLQEMTELETKYQSELKDTIIRSQKSENKLVREKSEREQEKKELYYWGVILLSISLIAIFLVLRRNLKQKKALSISKFTIEKALDEKQILLKEIHHRVKNNFQIVSSILDLQTKGINDPKAIELANEGKNRVKSMALIHQNLYQNDDLKVVLRNYTETLLNQIDTMFSTRPTEINLDINEEFIIDIDVAIPLGLILNELATNAFKYGFNNESKGVLSIRLIELEGQNCLVFKDNGKGLPEDVDVTNTSTTGLRLIRLLSKQIRGKLEYLYNDGAEFKIFFVNEKKE